MACSLLAHLLAVAIAWTLAQGMGLELSVLQALALFPLVLFAALVPVSVGGWGVREGAAVLVFVPIGWTAADAVALSLLFGLTQVVAASPGVLLDSGRRDTPRD